MFDHPRRYDLIAFDWDGTLYDSTAVIARAIQAAVFEMGFPKPSDERARYVIGLGLTQALAYAAPDVPHERYPELARRYQHHYHAHLDDISLFPGVLPMLAALRERHHWLAVATGKSRRGLNDTLAHVELQGVFDASRTADETAGKPSPLMLFELMREFGVSPERTLMIGDTSHDLQMAKNAGCDSVAVSYGAHGGDGLDAYGARAILHSVNDLHRWLMDHA